MAYTLADYQRLAPDHLKKGVIDVFRRESIMMNEIGWETTETLSTEVMRTKSLPTVAFRRINENFSESKGLIDSVQERVFDIGGYVDVDKMLVRAKSLSDQRALQTDMFVTAAAYAFQDYFINGSPAVDEDGFTGLFWRITKYHTAQEKNLNGLDVSPDATSLSANLDTLLDGLQELIHMVDGHAPDILAMNDTLYLRICSALRQKGYLATTTDSYNREVKTYGEGGPKLIDMGVKADQTTRIIGNVELANGTALTGGADTSVYAIKLGEKYLQGIQLYPLEVEDIGKLETGTKYRTVIDWPVGLSIVHPRSVARLSGIIAA